MLTRAHPSSPHSYILHAKKTAFVVEHDIVMATYLADRVVVYSGTPSVESFASACVPPFPSLLVRLRLGTTADEALTHARRPESLLTGMNKFLKSLEITFRRDPTNFRCVSPSPLLLRVACPALRGVTCVLEVRG